MSRRRQLEEHRHRLGEIREIMNSMKTLAYMETHKLARFLDTQNAMVHDIEAVAADFLAFYPDTLPSLQAATPVFLLIGSERGFCGDFNEALVRSLETYRTEHQIDSPTLIPVGQKLHHLLESNPQVHAFIEGAGVIEEVSVTMTRIIDTLTELQASHGPISLTAIHHDEDAKDVVIKKLLPPFHGRAATPPPFSHPPLLNLSPAEFLLELTDHYLFAVLHQLLYNSLMAENYRRVRHLEGAVRHLDEETAKLGRQGNALRQEEIIEEIEVILLSFQP